MTLEEAVAKTKDMIERFQLLYREHPYSVYENRRTVLSVVLAALEQAQTRVKEWERKREDCIREERELRDAHWRGVVQRANDAEAAAQARVREVEAEKARLIGVKFVSVGDAAMRIEAAEAREAKLRKAAEFACDEHEKEDGTECRDCTGMMELRAALAEVKLPHHEDAGGIS